MRMVVNPEIQVSSQCPAFGRSVPERMQAQRERVAAKIKAEMARRGEQPRDIAYVLGIAERTIERWLARESEPRLRNLKALAEHWSMDLSELRPDLEQEERELQAQLDRIEANISRLLAIEDRLSSLEQAQAGAGRGIRRVNRDHQRHPRAEGEDDRRAG